MPELAPVTSTRFSAAVVFSEAAAMVWLSMDCWFGMRWKKSDITRYVLGLMGLTVGIGFMYFHVSGNRPLSVAGDKSWWNRIAHSLFYLAFGIRTLMGDKDAYLFLLGDVVYGVWSFVRHHIGNGDFKALV